jgi:hypothetical protein
VTPAAGTAADTLFIYGVPGSNTIQVGKGSTNTYGCSGCQVNSGISAPPSNSYAIYKCAVTVGQVVPAGCTPLSTPYSNTSFENGLGTLPLVDTVTGALQINNDRSPRTVTSGSDTITNLDCGGMVIYNEASTVNVALPQAGIGNPVTFASGCDIWLANIGAGSVQITPNSGSPINGSTGVQTLGAGSATAPTGMYLVSNGSVFNAVVAGASGGSLSGGTITNPLTVSVSSGSGQITVHNSNAGQSNGISYVGTSQNWYIGSSNADGVFAIADTTASPVQRALAITPSSEVVSILKGVLSLSTQVTPASSSSACTVGMMEADANYIYVCTATNTWKRATLATF